MDDGATGVCAGAKQPKPLDEDVLSQILKVLLEMSASLKRLEMDKSVRREGNADVHEVEEDGKSGSRPRKNALLNEDDQYDEETISQKHTRMPQVTETHFYVIDTSKISSLAPASGDFYVVSQRPGTNFCPDIHHDFPEMVSNNTWRYYKPTWPKENSSDGLDFVTLRRGMGKHNFLPPWNEACDNINDHRGKYVKTLLTVPYSATPPYWSPKILGYNRHYSAPPTGPAKDFLQKHLGSIWTIPPDSRLSFEFQEHMIRQLEGDVTSISDVFHLYEKRFSLYSYGGYIEVMDIDSKGHSYTYSVTSASAIEVEQWFLEIPPQIIPINETGFPYARTGIISAPWRRLVTVCGAEDVYSIQPWTPETNITGSETTLFDLYTICAIGANVIQDGSAPTIFHICWMEIWESAMRPVKALNSGWDSQEVYGLPDRYIRTVAGSIEIFVSPETLTQRAEKWWTILVLTPNMKDHALNREETEPNYSDLAINTCTPWIVALREVSKLLSTAVASWSRIAIHLDSLLVFRNGDELASKIEKGDARSVELFAMINKIDEILPMVADAVLQWEWFRDQNNLNIFSLKRVFYPEANRRKDNLSYGPTVLLNDHINKIQELVRRLVGIQKKFEALRDRARSLRDGLFALTSVQEARQSRLLGENVKVLTYVTIFYLPLAFCASLWAVNDMFGTGTHGFAIVTAIVGLGTYAVVFTLTHRGSLSSTLKKWASEVAYGLLVSVRWVIKAPRDLYYWRQRRRMSRTFDLRDLEREVPSVSVRSVNEALAEEESARDRQERKKVNGKVKGKSKAGEAVVQVEGGGSMARERDEGVAGRGKHSHKNSLVSRAWAGRSKTRMQSRRTAGDDGRGEASSIT